VDVFTVPDESPVKISRGAVKKAIDEGYDMVIIDTAGRQVYLFVCMHVYI
jgi:signal recognition particle GTPase